MNYEIEKEDNFTVIYPIDEPYRIQKIQNFEELMKKYKVYKDSLKNYIKDMIF